MIGGVEEDDRGYRQEQPQELRSRRNPYNTRSTTRQTRSSLFNASQEQQRQYSSDDLYSELHQLQARYRTAIRAQSDENRSQTESVSHNTNFEERQAVIMEKFFTQLVYSNTSLGLLSFLFLFRCLNALLVETHFDPDEYWQSLEVAHKYVFGYGHLTWEWSQKIRGFAHPLLFAVIYKLIGLVGLDNTDLIILGPKIFQASIAALNDFYTFLIATQLFGLPTGKWTIIMSLFSWFNAYCMVRSYSNSLEALLNTVALFYWPFSTLHPRFCTRSRIRTALFFAACACLIRPSSLIIWTFLYSHYVITFPSKAFTLTFDACGVGLVALLANMWIDYRFYHKWTIPALEFYRVNVVNNISFFYGGHPFHWYFTQGIPVVLFTLLPISVYGILYAKHRTYAWMCLSSVIALSYLAHKEFRFLLSFLPVLIVYAGYGLHVLELSETNTNPDSVDTQDRSESTVQSNEGKRWLTTKRIVGLLGSSNALLFLYLGRVHQSGVIQVMNWLRKNVDKGSVKDILFLMPCHSTPYYSYLHRNVSMRFITCEPPLNVANKASYVSETDLLYESPQNFFQTYFAKDPSSSSDQLSKQKSDRILVEGQPYSIQRYSWPSHVVLFDNSHLLPAFKSFVNQPSAIYKECARFFNSHFHDDDRRRGDVVVYCR